MPNAKVLLAKLKKGDGYVLRSGGGGGFGPAWQRDAEAVLHDVRQGYVSPEAAARNYGVVLIEGASAIDQAATRQRRAEMARRKPAN